MLRRCRHCSPCGFRRIIYSGGFLLGIKAFSGGARRHRLGAPLGGLISASLENYGQAVFGTQVARRRRLRAARAGAADPADGHPR